MTTTECGAERIAGGEVDPYGFACDLPRGHEGYHVAHNAFGSDTVDVEWFSSRSPIKVVGAPAPRAHTKTRGTR